MVLKTTHIGVHYYEFIGIAQYEHRDRIRLTPLLLFNAPVLAVYRSTKVGRHVRMAAAGWNVSFLFYEAIVSLT